MLLRPWRCRWNVVIFVLFFVAISLIFTELLNSSAVQNVVLSDIRAWEKINLSNSDRSVRKFQFQTIKPVKNFWSKDDQNFAIGSLLDANLRRPKLRNLPKTTIYVFSAFFDLRDGNKGYKNMRIIAISTDQPSLYCLFPTEGPKPLQTEVSWYTMAENHGRAYKTFMLNCAVPVAEENLATFQLVHQESQSKINITAEKTIRDPMPGVPKYKYSICTPVLFGNKYKPANLIEFFETVKLLGTNHVFMYTNVPYHQMDLPLLDTLRYYSVNQSFLTVFPLVIPFQEHLLFYHGQLVAIADCLYHNMGLSKFVFFHDFDERIVPYSSTNYDEMFGSIWEDNLKLAGFGFDAYYFEDYAGEPLVGIRKTKQIDIVERRFTKCVVRPERIFEQGVHHISRHVQDWHEVKKFDLQRGALHHYKSSVPRMVHFVQNTRLKDLVGDELERRFNEVMKGVVNKRTY